MIKSDFLKWVPAHVHSLLRMMLVSLGLLTLLRILFLAFYWSSFHDTLWTDWLAGLWFDLLTVSIAYFPFSLVHFLPIPFRNNRVYRIFIRVYFYTLNTLLLALNILDLEYYRYTGKRSTYDLMEFVSNGDDLSQLAGTFLVDFWWMWLVLGLFIFTLFKVFQKWIAPYLQEERFKFLPNFFSLLVMVPLIIILGRGGLQLRPMGIIEAANYTRPSHTAFVLNTGFTMVKSYGQKGIEQVDYMSETEERKFYNPVHTTQPAKILGEKTNVVVLILESFGNEWVAANNADLTTSYTPFLDELSTKSIFYTNGYANGKKSIEAVPAIIASMPSLMTNPYITSQYSGNQLNTLPSILKKSGYSSAFFHGATNGSMRFDSFASLAGYDQYFGRTEYNNDDHFDQTWGILDEYFNPWSARQMSQLKAPFCATLFTLSSHHPYYVPANRKKDVVQGPEDICASISYGDYSLKKFFEEAKKQPWYNNTLFVLVADHTPASNTEKFNYRTEMYRVPILFYHPGEKLKAEKRAEIFQQIDILPSVLDLLDIQTQYYAIGQSMFSKKERFALTYLEGVYYYFSGRFMLNFSGSGLREIIDKQTGDVIKGAEKQKTRSEWEPKVQKLKAIVQRYNRDLIMNQTHVE